MFNYRALYNEVINDPVGLGYTGKSDQQIADLINAKTRTKIGNVHITEKMIYDKWDSINGAEAFIAKLEAAAVGNTILARIIRWLKPSEQGVDAGHPFTRTVFQALRAADVITVDELSQFKRLAEITISRADELGWPLVLPGYINKARLRNG